jgi:hypothetical protein
MSGSNAANDPTIGDAGVLGKMNWEVHFREADFHLPIRSSKLRSVAVPHGTTAKVGQPVRMLCEEIGAHVLNKLKTRVPP